MSPEKIWQKGKHKDKNVTKFIATFTKKVAQTLITCGIYRL